MLRQQPLTHILFVVSMALYICLGYTIERHQTLPLFLCYFMLFVLYVRITYDKDPLRADELRYWLGAAVLFRFALVFSVPSLSDDFYRFIWDGRLMAAGYHPFADVPSFYMTQPVPGLDKHLYDQLNAQENFTVYPPVAQLIFWLSVKLSPHSIYGSMLVMKVIAFAFEIATCWILTRILRQYNLPSAAVLLYALNPLVILEFTGNLHHEGIMIFFLFLAVYFIRREQSISSSISYALSICTKLIPLIFLPLMLRYLGFNKYVRFWLFTMGFTLLFFLPLLNGEIVSGFSTSLGYYFQRFEFNASIYYLIREAGYAITGFNIIQYAGPALALTAAAGILIISLRKIPAEIQDNIDLTLFSRMLWCLVVYFLSAAILHPWYIITLFALSILTPYRFPLVWTGAIFLTYAGYTETGFEENYFMVALEYTIVTAFLLYETLWKQPTDRS